MRIVPASAAKKPWRTPAVKVQTIGADRSDGLPSLATDGWDYPDPAPDVTTAAPAERRYASR